MAQADMMLRSWMQISSSSVRLRLTLHTQRLRARAHASQKSGYSLNDILDEWSREFYFEGRRRVDLIRFGKFGGETDYVWQWKGGTYVGRNFNKERNIYAIPAAQLPAYGNVQNPGY